jgi:hypothetical protein
MGQLKSDGRAHDTVAPAGTITFGELYRMDNWTGIAMKSVAVGDTNRKLAMEISSERIWYVLLPAGVTGAVGDRLYWTAGAGLKVGSTDITATVTGSVVAIVEEAKDANNIAGVRVVNI